MVSPQLKQTEHQNVKAVWIRCASFNIAENILYLATSGHLEYTSLRARRSPIDSRCVDVEFRHFEPSFLAALSTMQGVEEVGIIDVPITDWPNQEMVREIAAMRAS